MKIFGNQEEQRKMKFGLKKIKQKRGQFAVGALITMLVVAIIGIAVTFSVVSSLVSTQTSLGAATQDGQTLNASVPTIELSNDFVSGEAIIDAADSTIVLTKPANYTIASDSGIITAGASLTEGVQTYNVSYNFEPDGYVSNATDRLVANTLPTLVLVVVVMMFVALFALGRKEN